MTDRAHDMIQGLIEDAAKGAFQGVVDREFKLSDAAAAHAYMESRRAVGRVLLIT
jgi:NADPH2:quinone reductase